MQSTGHKGTILVGEDEPEVRSYLEMALRYEGFQVELAENGDEVMDYLQRGEPVAAILLDIMMPRKDGMDTLRSIREIDSSTPVIMLSGISTPWNIVEAMKSGANDFIAKPVNCYDLGKAINQVLASRVQPEPAELPEGSAFRMFFGSHPSMREIQSLMPNIVASDAPVLIQGETGTGKEMLARELHAHSPRGDKPMLKLNCAALPSELVESELFGYERGAFTGAFQRRLGMFELADGGTILLDEIGDMDFKLQAKLLQVLQDHEFQRLGGKGTVRVNVRVLAATHQDLEKAMREGRFREDLYYRLNVITLHVPPLRERKKDTLELAEFLLGKHAAPNPAPIITPVLRQAILNHSWPGNIRELENAMRRLLILRDADSVARELRARSQRLEASQPAPPAAPMPAPAPEPASVPTLSAKVPELIDVSQPVSVLAKASKAKEQAETEAILSVLNQTRWNRKQAAAILQIDYKALLYKMKKLAIDEKYADRLASATASGTGLRPAGG